MVLTISKSGIPFLALTFSFCGFCVVMVRGHTSFEEYYSSMDAGC